MSFYTTSSTYTTSILPTPDHWEKAHYLSLTLWDIERELQKSSEAYEQWLHAKRPKKSRWDCFGAKKVEDELVKALRLGRHVRDVLEKGIEAFGPKFEQGDCESAWCAIPISDN